MEDELKLMLTEIQTDIREIRNDYDSRLRINENKISNLSSSLRIIACIILFSTPIVISIL